MRENTLKAIWARGAAVVNGWLSIPSAFSAEIMAHQGFDSLTVDMQHGVVDYQTAVTMLQAVSTTSTIPLARVAWNDPALLMKILDAGVYGVICPMVSTVEQAEAMVKACKYPPQGYRSWGPVRASIYAGADYGDHANDDVLVMPMIETAEALENLDAILQVPGIDAVYVGPSDLSLALGYKPPPGSGRACGGRRAAAHRFYLQEVRRHRRPAQQHAAIRPQDDRGGLPVRHHRLGKPLHGGQGSRGSRRHAAGQREGRHHSGLLRAAAHPSQFCEA